MRNRRRRDQTRLSGPPNQARRGPDLIRSQAPADLVSAAGPPAPNRLWVAGLTCVDLGGIRCGAAPALRSLVWAGGLSPPHGHAIPSKPSGDANKKAYSTTKDVIHHIRIGDLEGTSIGSAAAREAGINNASVGAVGSSILAESQRLKTS